MTKGEQARLTAWRLKVLQHAATEQNVAREEAEGIGPAVVEAERQAVRAAITQRDVARLRAKVLPQNESATTTRRA